VKPPIDEETRARNLRSLVIALGLGAFVVLVFVIAIVRMGGTNVTHF
jgi:hypothetical protein